MIVYECGNGDSGYGGIYDNGCSGDFQMDIDYPDYSCYIEASNIYPPSYEEALKMKSLQQKESIGVAIHNSTANSQPSNRQQPRNIESENQQERTSYWHYEQEPEEFQFVTCLPMIIVIILLLIIIPKCVEKYFS